MGPCSLRVPGAVFQRGDGLLQGSDLGVPLPHRLHQVAVGLLRLFQQLPGCRELRSNNNNGSR